MCALKRFVEAFVIDRLRKVIEGGQFKSLQGKAVVGSGTKAFTLDEGLAAVESNAATRAYLAAESVGC